MKKLFVVLYVVLALISLQLAGCGSILDTEINNTLIVTTAPDTPPPVATIAEPTAIQPPDTGVYTGGAILIKGDEQFLRANGVTGGTGTQADPYIIEGWTIDISEADTTAWPYVSVGIIIDQTSKYYIVRDCTITNTSQKTFGAVGITIADNGRVENCAVQDCPTGIRISGSNTVITGNTVANGKTGIASGQYLYTGVTISGNTITNCTDEGIDFNYVENSLAEGNTVTGCGDGINVNSVFNSTVSRNTVQNSRYEGIEVDAAFTNCNAAVDANEVTGSKYTGITVHCSNNVISNNTVTGNGTGILLDNVVLISDTTSNNLVKGNTVNNNAKDGIRVDCPYNTISNNTALGNNTLNDFYSSGTPEWVDLYVFYLQYNTLENNTYGTSYLMEAQ